MRGGFVALAVKGRKRPQRARARRRGAMCCSASPNCGVHERCHSRPPMRWSPSTRRAHANKGRRLFSGTISKAQILHETTLAARAMRSRRSAPASVVPQPLYGLSGTSVACCSHTSARPPDSPSCVGPSARAVFRLLPLHNHGGCAPWSRKPWSFHVIMALAPWIYGAALPSEPCLSPGNGPLHAACLPAQWAGGVCCATGPRRHSRRVNPVASFVCACVPGATRWHAPARLDCLAQAAFRLRSCGSCGAILLEALSSECGV